MKWSLNIYSTLKGRIILYSTAGDSFLWGKSPPEKIKSINDLKMKTELQKRQLKVLEETVQYYSKDTARDEERIAIRAKYLEEWIEKLS